MNRDRRIGELMELVAWQLSFGVRHPGSDGHIRFRKALEDHLKERFGELFVQPFSIKLCSQQSQCANFIVRLPRTVQSGTLQSETFASAGATAKGPLLLGTHFDTRLTADQEENETLRNRPILGANDGGSGTAVLLHLADRLRGKELPRDVFLAFFDAEDVGDIDGYPFSVGAGVYASHPLPTAPHEVIILDMVGGKDLNLNLDKHIYQYPASRALTDKIWKLARKMDILPVYREKPNKLKYIICDHTPFQLRGYAACVLIDIDYPEWHTHKDLTAAMSGETMVMIEDLMLEYLMGGALKDDPLGTNS